MTHEVIIIVVVLALFVCLSSSNYAGLSFKLTRSDDDYFKNPTAKICDTWQTQNYKQFCKDTNSRCDRNCCQCTCDPPKSTFDSNDMKCQTNNELRKGKLLGNDDTIYIKWPTNYGVGKLLRNGVAISLLADACLTFSG